MLRLILGMIAGYIVMFILVFALLTGAYLGLGADGAYQPGTYDVNMTWIAIMIVVGLVAAVGGGFVCALISRHPKAGLALGLFVLILGLLMAAMTLAMPVEDPGPRAGDVPNMEAMMKAQQPTWSMILNPIIGLVGAIAGAKLVKPKGNA